MIPNIGDIKYQGIVLEYKLPISFVIGDFDLLLHIHYKENPSCRDHRGWRTLEAIQTEEYWIDEEKGFCDHYFLCYLKDTFKIDCPDSKLSEEEINKLFSEVLIELKKIMHERKIEIPGMTIETGDEND